jgi:hypothetical protein
MQYRKSNESVIKCHLNYSGFNNSSVIYTTLSFYCILVSVIVMITERESVHRVTSCTLPKHTSFLITKHCEFVMIFENVFCTVPL